MLAFSPVARLCLPSSHEAPIRTLLIVASAAALIAARPALRGPTPVRWPSEPGEKHLVNIRQITFGGNNAESYFSADGKRLIFQHKDSVAKTKGCDQEFVMNIDGSNVKRISNGQRPYHVRLFYLSVTSASCTVRRLRTIPRARPFPIRRSVTSGRSVSSRSTPPVPMAATCAS